MGCNLNVVAALVGARVADWEGGARGAAGVGEHVGLGQLMAGGSEEDSLRPAWARSAAATRESPVLFLSPAADGARRAPDQPRARTSYSSASASLVLRLLPPARRGRFE